MKELDKKEMKELLVKCWMTHDGLWFYHSLQECGIEPAKISAVSGGALFGSLVASSSAFEGGVTGSLPPDKSKVGISVEIGSKYESGS